MRILLDTNVVISGLLWDGAPARLIDCGIAGKAEFCTSARLIAELGRSLGKPHLIERLRKHRQTAEAVMRVYSGVCETFEPAELAQPIAPDPDDDWVIATALAANADLIVTGDKPFLGVGTVGSIQIVSVAEALELVAAS
jgi:uncharacterized protein